MERRIISTAVLQGKTKGYKNHSQLYRFKQTEDPIGAIGLYLLHILNEGIARGYKFDCSKIERFSIYLPKINVTSSQLEYEKQHLENKIRVRSPNDFYRSLEINPHPLFNIVDGDIEFWEKTK